ncbi:MAG: hypothetical protein BWY82_01834 [Verrucomicrobia bacterium ADurb.Bin474]|nr:MAG: hypothetical protein BWY82_01834 [Verrucomicrobia bacterium ADurb.Bin474]
METTFTLHKLEDNRRMLSAVEQDAIHDGLLGLLGTFLWASRIKIGNVIHRETIRQSDTQTGLVVDL